MTCHCRVCGQNLSKYKCPTCSLPYCSLTCWKSHNATKCERPAEKVNECQEKTKNLYEFETDDTVPLEKLALLENDAELRQVLNNPHVQSMLLHIDSASDSSSAIHAAMLEPIFVEFADRCLKIIEPMVEEK